MEEQIARILYLIVFAGPVAAVKEADPQTATVIRVENAKPSPLEKALRSGRVQYGGGVFSGNFSADIAVEIRRLGGSYDARMKIYHIDAKDVPAWVKAAAQGFRARAKDLHENIMRMLDETQEQLDLLIEKHAVSAEPTIDRVVTGFEPAARAIGVAPKITPESKELLAAEYSDNMKLYIKSFSESSIQALRDVVEENAMRGYRFDRLIKGIQTRYGVARSKAEFLARQETALFMSKYRELRFKEGGVRRYVWHTSEDERVRSSHKRLDGRTFSYDDPPVVDDGPPVRRANPGQDYNCRCVDAPVLETAKEAA